jgi:DNA-directed RNA polymerase specialized sigma24 family protein
VGLAAVGKLRDAFSRGIDPWEFELIAKVAWRFRTTDRDDLKAELARRLLVLKTQTHPNIRSWRAYVAKFLFNKAANWVRDERARQRRKVNIDTGKEGRTRDYHTLETIRPFAESDTHLRIAFARLWKDLDPEMKRFWQALAEENGNQTQVARRLHKHRNTVRLWIRKIKQAIEKHDLQLGA